MKNLLTLKKAVFRTAAVFALSLFLLSTPVYAAEADTYEVPEVQNEDDGIQPHSDIIDWLYKKVGGRLYRRRFNFTKGEWEDEYWTECV